MKLILARSRVTRDEVIDALGQILRELRKPKQPAASVVGRLDLLARICLDSPRRAAREPWGRSMAGRHNGSGAAAVRCDGAAGGR